MPRPTLVGTLTEPPDRATLARLAPAVGWLEVRGDLVGDLEPGPLREAFPGKLLYTLRSAEEGGRFQGSRERRRERMAGALAAGYDLVDLEAERDLSERTLLEVPPDRRLVSWHGTLGPDRSLLDRFERMSEAEALLYKLVPTPQQTGDEVAPLVLLGQLPRADVVAFAGGRSGTWTRLVAALLGCPLVYGAIGEEPGAPGQPSVDRLVADYGLPDLPAATTLCGVVGHPVLHSLSPRLHNRAYRALGLPFLYLAFEVERFGDFWLEVVEEGTLGEHGVPLRGLSVTAPFKGAALAVAGATSPLAERLGTINTLTLKGGVWEGENTDCQGVMRALQEAGVALAGKRLAVVGSGRAGRAAAFAASLEGAEVTLVNRSVERGEIVAQELELPFVPLDRFRPAEHEVLVNATSLGRAAGDPLPFAVDGLPPGSVVLDLVYGEEPTPLIRAARERGLVAIDGRVVLLHQGAAQFRLMTGEEMPLAVGREALGLGTEATS